MGSRFSAITLMAIIPTSWFTMSVMTSQRMMSVKMMSTRNSNELDLPWFKDGLSFKCSMCGNCCSGSSGSIRFTEIEGQQMAKKLMIAEEVFYDKFTRKQGRTNNKYIELKETRQPDGTYDCIFLDRNIIQGKKICSLYEARPTQCRTWPFWPELLISEGTWKDAGGSGIDDCPGINKGQKVSFESIMQQMDETIEARDRNV